MRRGWGKILKFFRGDGIHVTSGVAGYLCDYSSLPEWEEAPEIDGDVLQMLQPYKSTIFEMLSLRIYSVYYGRYDELEVLYLRHVKFWSYYLKKYHIDVIFFPVIPHLAWEYTLYALAKKVYKIPTLLIYETHIRKLCLPGTCVENIGNNLISCYSNDKELKCTEIERFVQRYYSNVSGEHSAKSNLEKTAFRKQLYHDLYYVPSVIKPFREIGKCVVYRKKGVWESFARFLFIQNIRRKCREISYYNRKTHSTPINEEYVCFFLQLTPEASTLPWAGEYSNQLIGVRLLAEALGECNIRLVVKEHWVQPYRTKAFYDELFSIPNLCCVDTSVDSY